MRRDKRRNPEGFQNVGSCCGAVVFVDESAESVAALDCFAARWRVGVCWVGRAEGESAGWGRAWLWGDEDRLMERVRPEAGLASLVVPGRGLWGETRLGWPSLTLWAASPSFVVGRPCDCPGVPRAGIRSCRFVRLFCVGRSSERR